MKRVIVTRPAAQAEPWLQALQAAGFDAQPLPLIDIRPARNTQTLHALLQSPVHFAAAMFVSVNAVKYFYEQNRLLAGIESARAATNSIANQSHQDISARIHRYWATGAGTVAALRAQGVAASHIDAPGDDDDWDSETLWQRVQQQVQRQADNNLHALIVRGANARGELAGRSWLADQLSAAGVLVQQVAVYERHPPAWNAAQTHSAQQALQDGSVWLLSSSEAVAHLPVTLQTHAARALATHPRVAQAAQTRGFAQVQVCAPSLPSIIENLNEIGRWPR
jgi:uroporphyrinogen-III synthase